VLAAAVIDEAALVQGIAIVAAKQHQVTRGEGVGSLKL
jgi:hypothetical protein